MNTRLRRGKTGRGECRRRKRREEDKGGKRRERKRRKKREGEERGKREFEHRYHPEGYNTNLRSRVLLSPVSGVRKLHRSCWAESPFGPKITQVTVIPFG